MKDKRKETREVSRVQPRYTEKAVLTDQQYEDLDNKFYYDRRNQPDNMVYEWKRYSVLGKEDRTYMAKMLRHGWTPVPASRHPETAGEGALEESILIEGQILMEQPVAVYERNKERILQESEQGQRDHFKRLQLETPKSALKYSRSFEPQAIPE